MGFFSEIVSEARRGGNSDISKPSAPPAPVPAPSSPVPAFPASVPAPSTSKPEAAPPPAQPKQQDAPPSIDLTPAAEAADDTAARQAHEAAESKRKAEWDAKQAEKKAAEQAELDKLAALSDDDVISEAAKRVRDTTLKITRKNMKDQVADHIQALCQRDPAFARKTMHPRKSMIRCFRYISRKAFEYVKDELEADGIKPGPGSEGYGCDVPDDLCFQWAENYFNDPDAPEDHEDEEKFVPHPYVPKSGNVKAKKDKPASKPKTAPKKPAATEPVCEQISLM